jgi:ribosomal protein S18 acetylase RimI-like enzyme
MENNIKYISCSKLNQFDPIFIDARLQYPKFDEWVEKCQSLHRIVVTISNLDGLAILKYESDSIKICSFVIRPFLRRKGNGSKLMEELIAHSRKMRKSKLYISVLNSNDTFLTFCQKFGFSLLKNDGINSVFTYEVIL